MALASLLGSKDGSVSVNILLQWPLAAVLLLLVREYALKGRTDVSQPFIETPGLLSAPPVHQGDTEVIRAVVEREESLGEQMLNRLRE